jgi:hypothetical protein
MMKRPNTTSLEFLASEAGRHVTLALVPRYIEAAHLREKEMCKPEAADVRFNRLLDDFLAVLNEHKVVYEPTFGEELAEVYRERFFDLYPPGEKDACIYYLILAGVTKILAMLAINIWLLERGELGTYPNPKPDRPFLFLHLQWAREAFGWWAANLARLNYFLYYKPPCKPDAVIATMVATIGDATQHELARLRPEELENGCPVC